MLPLLLPVPIAAPPPSLLAGEVDGLVLRRGRGRLDGQLGLGGADGGQHAGRLVVSGRLVVGVEPLALLDGCGCLRRRRRRRRRGGGCDDQVRVEGLAGGQGAEDRGGI